MLVEHFAIRHDIRILRQSFLGQVHVCTDSCGGYLEYLL